MNSPERCTLSTTRPEGLTLGGIFDHGQVGKRVVTRYTKQCRRCLDTIPLSWFSDTCAECLMYIDMGGG